MTERLFYKRVATHTCVSVRLLLSRRETLSVQFVKSWIENECGLGVEVRDGGKKRYAFFLEFFLIWIRFVDIFLLKPTKNKQNYLSSLSNWLPLIMRIHKWRDMCYKRSDEWQLSVKLLATYTVASLFYHNYQNAPRIFRFITIVTDCISLQSGKASNSGGSYKRHHLSRCSEEDSQM